MSQTQREPALVEVLEPALVEVLEEPIVKMMMAADRVDVRALHSLLHKVARTLKDGATRLAA